MHPSLIILLFVCVYVNGAPNFIGNGKLQSRLKPDLEEAKSDDTNSSKPLALFRKEGLGDSKRKRCEYCRNTKACKVHQRCDICNIVCKDIDLSQLQIPEHVVGETQDDENLHDDNTAETTSTSSNNIVETQSLGPRHNLLAKILNIPKKDDVISAEKCKANCKSAKVFKQKTTSDDNDNTLRESNLQNQEKEINEATEEKKRLFKDIKSPKDELDKIISHAKALHARVSNREGLLKLRSRSILNKDEATSNEGSTEKSLLGNRSTSNRTKYPSIGLRRKFNDKPSHIPDTLLHESSTNKADPQQDPEEVELPLEFSNVEATLSSRNFNTQHSQEDIESRIGGIRDITHNKDRSLTPERFSLILQSLERKVENIADLVRETCRHPVVPNSEDIHNAPGSPKNALKKKLLGTPHQEEPENENQAQKGTSDLQNKLINVDKEPVSNIDNEEKSNENLEPEFKINDDELQQASNDNTLKEPPTIMSKSNVPETNDKEEKLSNTDDLLITEPSDKLNDDIPIPKPDTINLEKENFQEPQDEDDRSENPSSAFDPKLQLRKPGHHPNNEVFNAGSRSAEDKDSKENIKHRHQEPHRSIETEPLFDHSRPHNLATDNNEKSLEQSDIDGPADIDSTDKIQFDERDGQPVTPIPSLEQRFAEDESGNLEESDSDLKESEPMADKTDNPTFGVVGKIIPQDPKSNDKVLFVSDGMKLPFNIKKQPDGSYQLSVDVEKLCPSCNSGMCKSTINNIESSDDQIQNQAQHKISKRGLKKSDIFTNFHKKRKPYPVEKKRLTKPKRSIDSNSHPTNFGKFKIFNNLLNNSFDAKKNKYNKKSIFDNDQNDNKIEKQKMDVIQQKIDLLNNVLTWWKSFIVDKV